MRARHLAALLALATLSAVACGGGVHATPSSTAATASPGASSYSCEALAAALQAAGLSVSTTASGSSAPFEGMATHTRLLADGAAAEVFTFPTAAAASTAASQVDVSGTGYPLAGGDWVQVEWVGPPHIFARDRLIVIYVEAARAGAAPTARVATDQTILGTLRSQMGEEFAGVTRIQAGHVQ